jgi:beta-glucuronidase
LDLVERDKNRGGVVIWSIGNETPLSEERAKFMGNLATTTRLLDNTRLIAAALEVHQSKDSVIVDDPLGLQLDIVSFNEYAGWYWSNPKDMAKYHFSSIITSPGSFQNLEEMP